MDVQVKITNLPAIKKAFGKSPVLMSRNLDKAIHKSIFLLDRESKMKTPVDTGRLRASHRTSFQPLKGELTPTANYAIFVHEGTRYMRGRPFLREAVGSSEDKIQDFFSRAVQDTLNEIGKSV